MIDKHLVEGLINGGYLAKRQSIDKRFNYGLFKDNKVLIGVVSDKQYKRYRELFKEKKGIVTFNLNLVRQLHGKSLPKVLYKKLKAAKQS